MLWKKGSGIRSQVARNPPMAGVREENDEEGMRDEGCAMGDGS